MTKSQAFFVSFALILSGHTLLAAPIDQATIDWQSWQGLPIQNGGRTKPLDTLAWETLYLTSSRAAVVDSETGQELNATATYLTLLFEWSGWDHERRETLLLSQNWPSQYSYFHAADRWDKTLLLRVDYPTLKQMIGMPENAKFVPRPSSRPHRSSIQEPIKVFRFRGGGGC